MAAVRAGGILTVEKSASPAAFDLGTARRAHAMLSRERVGAIEVLDDQPADAVCGTVDSDVHVGADTLDHCDGRFEQGDLDAAVHVDPAARPILLTDTDRDPPVAVAVVAEDEAQLTSDVLDQRLRHCESLTVNVDNHCAPLVSPPVAIHRI